METGAMTPVVFPSGRCTPFSMGMKSGSQMKDVMGEGSSPYAHHGPESARRMRSAPLSPYGQMRGGGHEGAHSAGADYFEPQKRKESIASTSSGVPYRGPESARRIRITTLSSHGQMTGGEHEGAHIAGADYSDPQRRKEPFASTSSGVPYRGQESARRMRTTTISSYGQMTRGKHGRSTPTLFHMSAHESARVNQEIDQSSGLFDAPDAADEAFNQKPGPRLIGEEACNLFHKASSSTGIPWYKQDSSQNATRSVQSARGALGSRSGNGAMSIERHPASFAEKMVTINADPPRLKFNGQRIKTNKAGSSSSSLGRVPENYEVRSQDLLTDQFAFAPPPRRRVGVNACDGSLWSPHVRSVGSQTPDAKVNRNNFAQRQEGHHTVKHLTRQESTQTDPAIGGMDESSDERENYGETSSATSQATNLRDEKEISKDINNRGMIPGCQQQPFCGRPSGPPNFSSSIHNVMGKAARRPLGRSNFGSKLTGEWFIPNPQMVPHRRRDYAHSLIKADNRFQILALNSSRSTRSPLSPVGLSKNKLKMSPSAPNLGTPDLFTHSIVARPELVGSRNYVRWKY